MSAREALESGPAAHAAPLSQEQRAPESANADAQTAQAAAEDATAKARAVKWGCPVSDATRMADATASADAARDDSSTSAPHSLVLCPSLFRALSLAAAREDRRAAPLHAVADATVDATGEKDERNARHANEDKRDAMAVGGPRTRLRRGLS